MYDTVVIDSINYSTEAIQYVTMDHKTSLKCTFFEIKIYTSSESWLKKLSIDVWFVGRYNYLKIWNLRMQINLNHF